MCIKNNNANREGFYFNAGATHNKLVSSKARNLWVFEAIPLNPYLAQLKSFYAASVPFCVKSNLAPGIASNERYVFEGVGAPPRQIASNKVVFRSKMARRAE